jgi:hypothetical protein
MGGGTALPEIIETGAGLRHPQSHVHPSQMGPHPQAQPHAILGSDLNETEAIWKPSTVVIKLVAVTKSLHNGSTESFI